MAYRLVDLELSEPLPDLRLAPGQTGYGVVARWQGRPVGFWMSRAPDGAELPPDELRSWVQRECAARVLGLEAESALAARWPRPAAPTPPLLSIAICTRDRPERLERLLDSLVTARQGSPFPELEILVVDNAPADGRTRELIGRRFPDVRYLLEPRAGLNFARNAALRAATGGLLAYLDDDVVVDRHWLAGVHAAWADVPGAGGYTGLVLPLRLDRPAQLEFELQGGFRRGFDRIHHRPATFGNPLHPVGAGVVGAGCNMVFQRALLEALGGFDDALDTGPPLPGGGDLDIFYRVLRAGRTIVYEPRMTVFHEHRETLAQLRRQYWSWGLGFMAFVAKARRSDADMRTRHRAMIRWWFVERSGSLLKSMLRLRLRRAGFVAAELWGGLQGILGEYDRSTRRTERIREAVALQQAARRQLEWVRQTGPERSEQMTVPALAPRDPGSAPEGSSLDRSA